MKFRKKPVVIEAFNWSGDCFQEEDPEWVIEAMRGGYVVCGYEGTENAEMRIETLEGTMIAKRGDWIIKGVKNEIYPCKPDIFEATYERVEE